MGQNWNNMTQFLSHFDSEKTFSLTWYQLSLKIII